MVSLGWCFQAQVGSSQANFGEVEKSYSTILSNKIKGCAAHPRWRTGARPRDDRLGPERHRTGRPGYEPKARWNSLSRLNSSNTAQKAASVAKNSCRQKSSAARSYFSSAIRFSTSARWL